MAFEMVARCFFSFSGSNSPQLCCKEGNCSQVISREVFWHEYGKIPRHTGQNAITEGDLECILTRNCEATEQLHDL